MSSQLTRRQWLSRSGSALGGILLASNGLSMTGSGSRSSFPSGSPVRMMFNENPYGPSPAARKAMTEAFNEGNLYSGAARRELRELIARQENVTPDHIIIGAGSREILNVAGLLCGLENGALVSPFPTFEAINSYAKNLGATVHRAPLDDEMGVDLAKMASMITNDTKLVYLCNPNNPTGKTIPDAQMRPFCEEISKDRLVFVDEAYNEYVDDLQYKSSVELVREGRNIIVSRTASKIHGLAGLRVGFGIAQPDLIRRLQQISTGTTNIVGLRAAIASYRDREFQQFCLQKNKASKEIVYKLLQETGRRYLDSQTNFIFLHTGRPIEKFQQTMEKRGFLVGRPFPPYKNWCRLSLAKPEETASFAKVFRDVI